MTLSLRLTIKEAIEFIKEQKKVDEVLIDIPKDDNVAPDTKCPYVLESIWDTSDNRRIKLVEYTRWYGGVIGELQNGSGDRITFDYKGVSSFGEKLMRNRGTEASFVEGEGKG